MLLFSTDETIALLGLPYVRLRPLDDVLKAAATLIGGVPKFGHIGEFMQDTLHRRPVCQRILYRVSTIHSFIHSGHFYSAPSSPLLLRGAPDYSTDTVSEFHAEAHRQLQVKDLPKVPTWRLERESNPRPSG